MMAMAGMSNCAQAPASSSGMEAPSRKLNAEGAWSSTWGAGFFAFYSLYLIFAGGRQRVKPCSKQPGAGRLLRSGFQLRGNDLHICAPRKTPERGLADFGFKPGGSGEA